MTSKAITSTVISIIVVVGIIVPYYRPEAW